MKPIFSAMIASAALVLGSNVHAAACSVSGTANLGNASTDDATLSLNGGAATFSDACNVSGLGNGGNTDGTLLGAAFSGYGTGDFTRIFKFGEDSNSTFLGVNFTLTGADTSAGTWNFSWAGGPANLDIVLAIHASNASGNFLFDNRDLDTSSNGTGTWRIEWLNNGNQVPGFSNLTVWVREGDAPGPCVGPDCDPPGPCIDCNDVPSPAPLALLGLGIGAIAVFQRRRRVDA